MTLTKMLENNFGGTKWELDAIKVIFQQWLKEIPLGKLFDDSIIAQNMRHDLIEMVDEP